MSKLNAPATERNRVPILEVLRRFVPEPAEVLEIASGSGQHAAYFSAALPGVTWQPTDLDTGSFDSIVAWAEHEGADNVRAPLRLDVTEHPWPIDGCDVIFNANMIHISPWAACLGLMQGAGRQLVDDGRLLLYGPFSVGGNPTSDSNAAFDRSLRSQNPQWGVRDLEAVEAQAAEHDLQLEECITMPANNQILVFARSPRAG